MLIYSWNINGFNTCDKYGGFGKILLENPDILCLQEVKVGDPTMLNTLSTYQYKQYYSFSAHKGHNGVYIYSRKKAANVITEIGLPRFDIDGRFLCLEFEDCYLINVYMPHGGRNQEELPYKMEAYRFLQEFLFKIRNKNVVVMGDFNVAYSPLEVERYRSNQKNTMFTMEERETFKKLLDIGYFDVFRILHPGQRAYTWWPYAYHARERNIGWRIDYFLVSNSLRTRIENIEISKNILGSDHCPIKMKIDL